MKKILIDLEEFIADLRTIEDPAYKQKIEWAIGIASVQPKIILELPEEED